MKRILNLRLLASTAVLCTFGVACGEKSEEASSIHPDAKTLLSGVSMELYTADPDISADGSRVVFISGETGSLKAMKWAVGDVDEQGKPKPAVRLTTAAVGVHERQTWITPNGSLAIISALSEAGQVDLWLQAWDGGDPVQLTNDNAIEEDVSFSPDGQFVLYKTDGADHKENWFLAAVSAGGLTAEPQAIQGPSDGASIADIAWGPATNGNQRFFLIAPLADQGTADIFSREISSVATGISGASDTPIATGTPWQRVNKAAVSVSDVIITVRPTDSEAVLVVENSESPDNPVKIRQTQALKFISHTKADTVAMAETVRAYVTPDFSASRAEDLVLAVNQTSVFCKDAAGQFPLVTGLRLLANKGVGGGANDQLFALSVETAPDGTRTWQATSDLCEGNAEKKVYKDDYGSVRLAQGATLAQNRFVFLVDRASKPQLIFGEGEGNSLKFHHISGK